MVKTKTATQFSKPFLIFCFIVFALGSLIVFKFSQAYASDKRIIAYKPQTRTYYIAAEKTIWDYAPSGKDLHSGTAVPAPWGDLTKYEKIRYFEYTDDSFTKRKQQPAWLGILGPIIRGVEGDTIKVVFYNRADKPYSMHPHGVLYDKDNEGAKHSMPESEESMPMNHADTSMIMPYGSNAKGAGILPGKKYTYTWSVREDAAPKENEGGSKVWLYHSHVDPTQDIYDGLVGPIVITAKEYAHDDATPTDIDQELITLFMVHDESTDDMPEEEIEGNLKHAMNGYIFANLRGLEMKKGAKVRWHLVGLGNEVDLHTPHWHGNVVSEKGHTTDVVELLPATMKTVDMLADNAGEWMFHCHVTDHITAGMMASYFVN